MRTILGIIQAETASCIHDGGRHDEYSKRLLNSCDDIPCSLVHWKELHVEVPLREFCRRKPNTECLSHCEDKGHYAYQIASAG